MPRDTLEPDPLAEQLDAFLALTLYTCVEAWPDFPSSVALIGSADLTPVFDDACNRYADAVGDGRPARVIEVNLRGATIDVSDAADARIAEWRAADERKRRSNRAEAA